MVNLKFYGHTTFCFLHELIREQFLSQCLLNYQFTVYGISSHLLLCQRVEEKDQTFIAGETEFEPSQSIA